MSVVETLASPVDFEEWRGRARAALLRGVAPEDLLWRVAGDDLDLPLHRAVAPLPARELRIPRKFLDLGDFAIRHRDPERFARLYRLLARLSVEPRLIDGAADPDVAKLSAMAKAVARDRHKMTAFVRFREREGEGPRYVAWFEPEHLIEEHVAPFFVDRYASMSFVIATPRRAIVWDGSELRFGPGGRPADAPEADGFSAAWDAYFRAIFNPGRLMPAAMRKEMPKKYWANLPETRQIAPLLAGASPRVEGWLAAPAVIAERRLPVRQEAAMTDRHDALAELKAEARSCMRCPLYAHATQTVFGQGEAAARILFVGEQPGDKEDLAGLPFVGPAGALFDEALAAAGFDRAEAYVTNAVKHFKFTPRGKVRLHKAPDAPEISACRWWLDRELATVRAPLVVAMGATAVFALTGKRQTLKDLRGRATPFGDGRRLYTTVHPSYILRIPDPAGKQTERARFFAEIAEAAQLSREAA
jgi:probable DNA metabolism protein